MQRDDVDFLKGLDTIERNARIQTQLIEDLLDMSGGKVPAIALTAFARSDDRTRTLRAGFLVHVSKPVDPSELVATVASVAGRVRDDQE